MIIDHLFFQKPFNGRKPKEVKEDEKKKQLQGDAGAGYNLKSHLPDLAEEKVQGKMVQEKIQGKAARSHIFQTRG